MKFPINYYLTDVQSDIIYDLDPSGELIPERIIQGLPGFAHHVSQIKSPSNPKIIIINTWDFSQLRSPKFISHVRLLLDNGFLVFQADNDVIEPIIKLCDLNHEPTIIFDTKQLIKCLRRHKPKIVLSESILFDYYRINTILEKSNSFTNYQSLDYNDIMRCRLTPAQAQLIITERTHLILHLNDTWDLEMLAPLVTKACAIVLLNHSYWLRHNLDYINAHVPHDKIIGLAIDEGPQSNALFQRVRSNLKALTLTKQNIAVINQQLGNENHIKYLSLNYCLLPSASDNDLIFFPHLEVLTICGAAISLEPIVKNSPLLKKLTLNHANIGSSKYDLIGILNKIPLLETLELRDVSWTQCETLNELSYLKTLTLMAVSNISPFLLRSFLEKCPHLEELSLGNTLSSCMQHDDFTMPLLSKLSQLSVNYLSLQTVKLRDIAKQVDEMRVNFGTVVDLAQLVTVFKQFDQQCFIHLNFKNTVSFVNGCGNETIPAVKYISFSSVSHFDELTYLNLLQCLPNLTNMSNDLLSLQFKDILCEPIQLNLINITSLLFIRSISNTRLYSFIAGCPFVESITLKNKSLSTPLPQWLCLPQLRELRIYDGAMTNENFKMLVCASPYLQKLECIHVDNLCVEKTNWRCDEFLKIKDIVMIGGGNSFIKDTHFDSEPEYREQAIIHFLSQRSMYTRFEINTAYYLPLLKDNSLLQIERFVLNSELFGNVLTKDAHSIPTTFFTHKAQTYLPGEKEAVLIYLENKMKEAELDVIQSYFSSSTTSVDLSGCILIGSINTSKRSLSITELTLNNAVIAFESFKNLIDICSPWVCTYINGSTIICDNKQEVEDFIFGRSKKIDFSIDPYQLIDTFVYPQQKLEEWARKQGVDPSYRYHFIEKRTRKSYELVYPTSLPEQIRRAKEEPPKPSHTPITSFDPTVISNPDEIYDEKTWSQNLLIDRLTKYCALIDSSRIKKIRSILAPGICAAVSALYQHTLYHSTVNTLKEGESLWREKLVELKAWPGHMLPASGSITKNTLEQLLFYTDKYHFNYSPQAKYQRNISSIDGLLKAQSQQPMYLENAWHCTCLMFKDDTWVFFDPNFEHGQALTFALGDEERLKEQVYQLGHGLRVSSDTPLPDLDFDYAYLNVFLEQGGLWNLFFSQAEFNTIKSHIALSTLTDNALEAMFFINNNNKPMWYGGLIKETEFTLQWLRQYDLNHSLTNKINVQLNLLTQKEQDKLITHIQPQYHLDAFYQCLKQYISSRETIPAPLAVNVPTINTAIKVNTTTAEQDIPVSLPHLFKKSFENPKKEVSRHNRFMSKKNATHLPQTLVEVDHLLLKQKGKNLLVRFNERSKLENYVHHLQHALQGCAQDLFVINTVQDLKCAISSLQLSENNRCVILPSPSGAFHQLLTTHSNKQLIIVINWSNFTATELVQANTILDTPGRRADNTDIPLNAVIVSLQDMQADDVYLGSDFTSRHDFIFTMSERITISPVLLPQFNVEKIMIIEVDFYEDANWQRYFYGTFDLNLDAMTFVPSPLLSALEKNPHTLQIIFKNAPMKSASFRYALNSLISKREIFYLGKTYYLPQLLDIKTPAPSYSLKLSAIHSLRQGFAQTYDLALNPDTFLQCFVRYQCIDKQFISLKGLISAHQNKSLHLYLTRDISRASWAKLLDEADAYQCQLIITLAPGSNSVIAKCMKALPVPTPAQCSVSNHRFIHSNDLKMTEHELEDDVDKIVDVSEMKKSDLFYKINTRVIGESFVFDECVNDIWAAVLSGQTILLKGSFSPELADALAPLFQTDGGIYFNGRLVIPNGKIIVLSRDKQLFQYVEHYETKTYSFDDKLSLFSNAFQTYAREHDVVLSELTLEQLIAFSCQESYPNPPSMLWEALYQSTYEPIDLQFEHLHEQSANDFEQQRQCEIEKALAKMPIVFLSGSTGVGKSSFMHMFSKRTNVFFGDTIKWASSKVHEKIILFIDEANLEGGNWSMFETLFNKQPSIVYQGVYYPLTEHHRVVFAGNPANYGGARAIPSLFNNHPNIVSFAPMNNAYLWQNVLKALVADNEEIGRLFLKVYQHVKSIDDDAISARELQMMGFLFKAKEKDIAHTFQRAHYCALSIALNVLPKHKHASFNCWFETTFGESQPIAKMYPKRLNNYSLTPTHYPVYDKLHDLIQVRQIKQDEDCPIQFGGLSGLIIEGNPGVGKSHLVKQYLLAQGFCEANTGVPISTNHFYFLPGTMSLKTKLAILHRAFHEGAVVIMDEMNTAGVLDNLEREINGFLMGEDAQGMRAKAPGFTLIGTQNPTSMAGRKEASLAIARRMIKCKCPDYTSQDLYQITLDLGHSSENAANFVAEFIAAKRQIDGQHLTFREYIRVVTDVTNKQCPVVTQGFFALTRSCSSDNVLFQSEGVLTTPLCRPAASPRDPSMVISGTNFFI